MRSPQTVLETLRKHAQKAHYQYERLYRNLYNPQLYLLAYQNLYANKGSTTAGADGATLSGMSLKRIESLIKKLRDRSYQPHPARRQYIPKKSGNGLRPLGIPAADDKLVQEAVRMILESIYEPTFQSTSHGFRPGKSCHTALSQIQKTFTGVSWFVEGDIKGCFDNIDHHILVNILKRRIKDEAFIDLIWKLLRAGYLEDWMKHQTYSGTPQGSGVSPLLANIYMNELDLFMEKLRAQFGKGDKRRFSNDYVNANHHYARTMLWTRWNRPEFRARMNLYRPSGQTTRGNPVPGIRRAQRKIETAGRNGRSRPRDSRQAPPRSGGRWKVRGPSGKGQPPESEAQADSRRSPSGSAPGLRQKSAGGPRSSRDRRARMPCRWKHLQQKWIGSQPAGPGPPNITVRPAPARGRGSVRVSGNQGRMFAALSWAGQNPRPEPQAQRDAPRLCREARRLWGPRSGEPRSLPGDLSKRSKNLPRPPGSPPSAAWPSRRPAPQREPPSWAGG